MLQGVYQSIEEHVNELFDTATTTGAEDLARAQDGIHVARRKENQARSIESIIVRGPSV